jgi:hypothetical protein
MSIEQTNYLKKMKSPNPTSAMTIIIRKEFSDVLKEKSNYLVVEPKAIVKQVKVRFEYRRILECEYDLINVSHGSLFGCHSATANTKDLAPHKLGRCSATFATATSRAPASHSFHSYHSFYLDKMSSSHSGAEVDLLSSFVVLPPVHSEDHTPFPAEPNVVNHFGDDLYRGVLENYGGEATLTHSQTIGSTPLSSSPHDEVKKISEMRATYLKKGCQLRSPARDTSVSVLATLTDIELDILKQVHL